MRRAIVLGVALGALVLLVLEAFVIRAGLAAAALPKASGSSLWITSRAAGVTAFLALSLEVALGLLLSTGAADRILPRARVVEAHRWLSAVTLGMVAVHAGVLLGDRFIRFDLLDLTVPFLAPYRPFAVGLGILAAYVAVVVHRSFDWRKRLGVKVWRALHQASFAAYAAALLHGALAGTDSRALLGLYLVSSVVIGALVIYRFAGARKGLAQAGG